eukprot:g13011.t1
MSVRDKIAGFGGAATTSRPSGISSRSNSHHNNGFALNKPSSGGGGGKLKVPDVFKNATKPADVPAAAANTAGRRSSSSSSSSSFNSSSLQPSSSSSSSAPAKKWGAPAAGASNGTGVSAIGGRTNGNGVSNGWSGGGGGGASEWKAKGGAGAGAGGASRTAKRDGFGDTKKPRDILGIGAVMSAGPSSSLARSAAAPAPAARMGDSSSSSRNGSSGDLTRGRASPTGRPDKPKAGPRKLNLTRISAEKQRAALGLDKNPDEENDDRGRAIRPAGSGGVSASAAKPANGLGSSFNNRASSSSSSYSKPAASSSRSAASARAGGAAGGSGGGAAKLPSAGSLRSSGHNLW